MIPLLSFTHLRRFWRQRRFEKLFEVPPRHVEVHEAQHAAGILDMDQAVGIGVQHVKEVLEEDQLGGIRLRQLPALDVGRNLTLKCELPRDKEKIRKASKCIAF